MHGLILPALNLLILCVVLYFAARKSVIAAVRKRHELVINDLQDVRKNLSTAQEKHEEFTAKLKGVGVEIEAIRAEGLQDAAGLKQKILEQGQKTAAGIVSDAKTRSQTLFYEIKGELVMEFADQVIRRASDHLKKALTGEDKDRMRKEFSTQLGNK